MQLLSSLDKQMRDGKGEIVVVDDGSEPSVQEIYKNSALRTEVIFVRTDRTGPARARNAGVAAARGEFLLFIDDDCLPPDDWIEKYLHLMKENEADIMGSRLINMHTDNIPSVIYHRILDQFFTHKGGSEFLLTANMICRKDAFLKLSGFDQRLYHGGEDRDFVLRANTNGCKVIYTPDNTLNHYHAFTHTGLWKHTYMQGKGSWFLYKILSSEQKMHIKPLPFKVYARMAISFLQNPGGINGLAALFSFIIMQACSFISILSEYLRVRKSAENINE